MRLIIAWGKQLKSSNEYKGVKGTPRPAWTYRANRRNKWFRPEKK